MNTPQDALSESSPGGRRLEGRYAVLVILALALGLSAFAIVFYYRQQRRPIDFWGSDAAVLIVRAPEVMALRLAEADSARPPQAAGADEVLEYGQRRLRVVERVDAGGAGGLSLVRRSLVTDAAFDWSASPASEPDWQYALEFRDGEERATVLIAPDDATIGRLGSEKRASITPTAQALGGFLQEQFDTAAER